MIFPAGLRTWLVPSGCTVSVQPRTSGLDPVAATGRRLTQVRKARGAYRGRAREFKLITRLDDHRREDAGVPASDKTTNGSGAERTAQASGSPSQLASVPEQPSPTGRADKKAGDRPGVRRVRRAAEWGKKKYAGSFAEDLWHRLDAMDFINRGVLFAATLLLCLFPFLIVVSALAGRSVVDTLTLYTGLNGQAATDVDHLFASSAATVSAVVGTASMVFLVLGGIAAASALQEIYEQVFDLPHRARQTGTLSSARQDRRGYSVRKSRGRTRRVTDRHLAGVAASVSRTLGGRVRRGACRMRG
jgi:hypothetical protein